MEATKVWNRLESKTWDVHVNPSQSSSVQFLSERLHEIVKQKSFCSSEKKETKISCRLCNRQQIVKLRQVKLLNWFLAVDVLGNPELTASVLELTLSRRYKYA